MMNVEMVLINLQIRTFHKEINKKIQDKNLLTITKLQISNSIIIIEKRLLSIFTFHSNILRTGKLKNVLQKTGVLLIINYICENSTSSTVISPSKTNPDLSHCSYQGINVKDDSFAHATLRNVTFIGGLEN